MSIKTTLVIAIVFITCSLHLQGQVDHKKGVSDADIARQFVVDDMHAGEFCTENAFTLREYAPNSIMTNGFTQLADFRPVHLPNGIHAGRNIYSIH